MLRWRDRSCRRPVSPPIVGTHSPSGRALGSQVQETVCRRRSAASRTTPTSPVKRVAPFSRGYRDGAGIARLNSRAELTRELNGAHSYETDITTWIVVLTGSAVPPGNRCKLTNSSHGAGTARAGKYRERQKKNSASPSCGGPREVTRPVGVQARSHAPFRSAAMSACSGSRNRQRCSLWPFEDATSHLWTPVC